jgi:fumarate hydratase subunit beta
MPYAAPPLFYNMKNIFTPLTQEQLKGLRAGDEVTLSGTIYTARDQAHARLVKAIRSKQKLPLSLKNAIIYYCGPTPAPKGKIVGSSGPTTSSRMDPFTPSLLNSGLKGMIGKGSRSQEVRSAIKRHKAVYFLTYAGCGALLSQHIRKAALVLYPELGPEAIHTFDVEDFPLIVAIDSRGKSIYG